MSVPRYKNSTFTRIKQGLDHYFDPNHFMGRSSLDKAHYEVKKKIAALKNKLTRKVA